MKARLHQSGSIASFIIIGVVLVLATVGVLYWVQHKDMPVVKEEAPVVTTPKTEEAAPKGEEKADTEETSPTAPSNTSTTTPEPAPSVAMLSETGPSETAFQLIAIGALVATAAGFVRSRNLRSSL